ncbi:MAG TPA: heparinase II/III family protein, partial [Gemmatimonadaceae bacterium]|nr:heparinase II/III family protein [Gemmatimonadaceae bacterium]
MSLLASSASIRERAVVVGVGGSLAPLASSLAGDLMPLIERELYVPADKALLSRAGGRCPVDAVNLEFDPLSPDAHRCPVCGSTYRGELHDRAWIYWYQLWLAERAVHAAALAALGVAPAFATFAARVLEAYAERYPGYPNRDNVLGPTRVFFSTYLESIWLLNLCIATDLLEQCAPSYRSLGQQVRERIVEPSRALVGSYDEGASNRQVWNNAALFAAARLLGKDADAEAVLHAPSGLLYHLSTGLLADGTWYEGENYHLFAHRGLWYGVALAEAAGVAIPEPLVTRFQEGFATPFLTALPDFTLPSRRDSQYAISLRQWRFAELCELGLGRIAPRVDRRLTSALHRLYADDIPRADTGRARSSADVERNLPASRLSRADLGWRSLFHARAELPPLEPAPPGSVVLEAQGLAIQRRQAGRTYVALDYGVSGGGHGHPDRLNLLLFDGATRWLDDMGTGSYVDPSLHWYRSTLAHNAPMFDGRSQLRVDGELLAFDDRDDVGCVAAVARELAPGVSTTRTIVSMAEYLIDELTWTCPDRDVQLDLPFHLDARVESITTEGRVRSTPELTPAPLVGSDALEDGFRFVRDSSRLVVPANARVAYRAARDGRTLRGWTASSHALECFRAAAPGAPGSGPAWLLLWRVSTASPQHGSRAARGSIRTVLAWSPDIADVELGDAILVRRTDGSSQYHERHSASW